MNEVLRSVRALPGYRLELAFENGSTAVVNMAKRVQTIRFSRIASPEVFSTARAEGEKVVWSDAGEGFSVWCSELLETMLMD